MFIPKLGGKTTKGCCEILYLKEAQKEEMLYLKNKDALK